MGKKTSFFAGMMTMLLIMSLVGTALASYATVQKDLYYNGITVRLDGKTLYLQEDQEPFIINGTTFLPVRAISEALGLTVNFDGSTYTIDLTSNNFSKRETALSGLYSWISENKTSSNGAKTYHMENKGGVVVGLFSDSTTKGVGVMSLYTYSGHQYFCSFYLPEYGEEAIAVYQCSQENNSFGSLYCDFSIDPASFSSDSKAPTFNYVKDENGKAVKIDDIEKHENMAKQLTLACVQYLDESLQQTNYKLADFGFSAFKQTT